MGIDSGNTTPLLEVEGVSKRFGGIRAVSDVTFEVGTGTVLGLIGPNGSGKTTVVNMINGVYRPDVGVINLLGRPIGAEAPHCLAAMGLTRTFQTARVFSSLTVLDNMMLPFTHAQGARWSVSMAAESLDPLDLGRFLHTPASRLSGGQRKLVEFARALVTKPRLVLLDEPFAGVHPELKALMHESIRAHRANGVSFVVVSHEIPKLMELADLVICMDQGKIVATGTPDEVSRSAEVIDAYLGRTNSGAA